MVFYLSSTLSVSREKKLNCEELAKFLSDNNIITSVTSNMSSTPKMEYGCRLQQSISSKDDIKNIWNLLRDKYHFKCAHFKLDGVYDGCIMNYLRPSICPTNN